MVGTLAPRRDIPSATVSRLPVYLRALHEFATRDVTRVSSEELAAQAGVRPTQLRKDLSHLGSHGVRGVGYDVGRLTAELTNALGLNRSWPVAVVGMGNLGRALAAYSGFATEGFHVEALFDHDPSVIGDLVGRHRIASMGELTDVVARLGIAIGVIATPANSAQDVADALVGAGVRAILNFAPVALALPEGVACRSVDLATELHVLAFLRQPERVGADVGRGQ
ncbi:MAG: redox-sensing transcriptional repressor Rex [Actinomycetales bacterium]|uniref:Redox-sensing transcriptional repressor Rex n=1 Tax=Candidatus Phosphoribacter hodrii TaxID=2953743 RepID=A0A934X3M2_9MICO|nr:redox-sensing transcriptional repressor Rex [Candidatus Phosphoribacter hodrii]MBP8838781.1 redox-sensing transcriptional repressor Rex [Dermatophilaceae bacterium]OPZ52226.1 MAG: Redox-sensing transcriptional repressor Rex [bacterium ADurb.BinA028]MBK7273536.1 redox-sensing transcriptional repressor Rex [Candidatus Phosphoribacter hodrii]MBL0003514.1 redox-sensing transcriptional repressor Rex [Candidatus Phosphoribacter hodrii]